MMNLLKKAIAAMTGTSTYQSTTNNAEVISIPIMKDDIVIVIPRSGSCFGTFVYFMGRAMHFVTGISFHSDMKQSKAVLEARFGDINQNLLSREDIATYEAFVAHLKKHEPYFTSDKTVSMSEKKLEFLLG